MPRIVGAELDEYSDDDNYSSKKSGELDDSMPSIVRADNESDASSNQVEKGETCEDSDDGESHQQTKAQEETRRKTEWGDTIHSEKDYIS